MNESDRHFIESLFAKQSEETERRITEQTEEADRKFAKRLEETESRMAALIMKQAEETERRIDVRLEKRLGETEHRLQALMESMDKKIDLVAEGQQMLVERFDRFEHEVKDEFAKSDRRVTTIAADLAAHKADPRAHKGVYRVKEEQEEFGNSD